MAQLGRHDIAAVRAIASELAIIRPEARSALATVIPEIHELLGGRATALFSLAEAEVGLQLTRFDAVGFPTRFAPLFSKFLGTAPRHYGLFDPARPAPRDRNRVLASNELLPRHLLEQEPVHVRVFQPGGIGDYNQLRILLCEGPSLLGWFGMVYPAAFTERHRRLIAALAQPLRRRLLLERRMGQRERGALALEAALEQIAIPAFVVGERGVIHEMNPAGRALLATQRGGFRRAVVDAIAGRPHAPALQLVPLRARGFAPHWLVLVPAATPDARLGARVAEAASRWQLTPREAQVASWIARGVTNQRIAAELACAEHTVEIHVSHILAKADVASRAELVAHMLA